MSGKELDVLSRDRSKTKPFGGKPVSSGAGAAAAAVQSPTSTPSALPASPASSAPRAAASPPAVVTPDAPNVTTTPPKAEGGGSKQRESLSALKARMRAKQAQQEGEGAPLGDVAAEGS